ncbi:MAG: hypothetical protein H6505_03315 [Calditrichaeota bacterium]|nr:hypothetical protein [Calditrichota bacterium]
MRLMLVLMLSASLFAQTKQIGGYSFTITSSPDGMMQDLTVMKQDKSVWSLRDAKVELLDADALGMPRDLTGDKIPDVVIETYSGGAHCCFAQYVLSLGHNFEVLDTIDHPGKWADRDDDGLWEVEAADLVFDYWKLPHSDSPIPTVILEAGREGFQAQPDLMRTEEPTAREVMRILRDSRGASEWFDYGPRVDKEFMPASLAVLHREVVQLIYDGHAGLAMELLDTGWPPFIGGRGDYIEDLLGVLRGSPYRVAIAELNKGTLFGELGGR